MGRPQASEFQTSAWLLTLHLKQQEHTRASFNRPGSPEASQWGSGGLGVSDRGSTSPAHTEHLSGCSGSIAVLGRWSLGGGSGSRTVPRQWPAWSELTSALRAL